MIWIYIKEEDEIGYMIMNYRKLNNDDSYKRIGYRIWYSDL